MSAIDPKKLAALAKKNAAKAAEERKKPKKRFDDTLPKVDETDPDRERFFSEMKKREF